VLLSSFANLATFLVWVMARRARDKAIRVLFFSVFMVVPLVVNRLEKGDPLDICHLLQDLTLFGGMRTGVS
jgi:hypothetical protein